MSITTPESDAASTEVLKQLELIQIAQANGHPTLYDIKLLNIEQLAEYDTVEVDIEVYPRSREIKAKNFTIEPYEEYLSDKTKTDRYQKITDPFEIGFGLGVATALSSVLSRNHEHIRDQYLSWQELGAFLGIGYGASKFVRPWLEEKLVNLTRGKKIQLKGAYYTHSMSAEDDFINEREYARAKTYGTARVIPYKVAYSEGDKSSLIRMQFNKHKLGQLTGDINIGGLRFNKEVEEVLKKEGSGAQVAVHIKLGKYKGMFHYKDELRQILTNVVRDTKVGCIIKTANSEHHTAREFLEGECEYRYTRSACRGRRKQYLQREIIDTLIIKKPEIVTPETTQ